MKKKLKWLSCFKDDYSASDSFLELMDEQLKTKFQVQYRADCPFTAIMAHPLGYELSYDESTNKTIAKCLLDDKRGYGYDGVISWQHLTEKRLCNPSENYTEGMLIFNWEDIENVEYMLSQQDKVELIDLKKELKLNVHFDIEFDDSYLSSDFTFKVELLNPKEVAGLKRFIDNYINTWSKSNQEYLIYNFGEDKIEEGLPVYFLNTGRSNPLPILKAIFEGFEVSKIGIKKIELENR
jgi:hypothetical protein